MKEISVAAECRYKILSFVVDNGQIVMILSILMNAARKKGNLSHSSYGYTLQIVFQKIKKQKKIPRKKIKNLSLKYFRQLRINLRPTEKHSMYCLNSHKYEQLRLQKIEIQILETPFEV